MFKTEIFYAQEHMSLRNYEASPMILDLLVVQLDLESKNQSFFLHLYDLES